MKRIVTNQSASNAVVVLEVIKLSCKFRAELREADLISFARPNPRDYGVGDSGIWECDFMINGKSWYIRRKGDGLSIWLPGTKYTVFATPLGESSSLQVAMKLPHLMLGEEETATYVGKSDYFPTRGYPLTDYEIVRRKELYTNPESRWYECTDYMTHFQP
jgi:hypothetical protein